MEIQSLSLKGNYVRLEPLGFEYFDALCAVGFDESIWQWTTTQVKNADQMKRYIASALDDQQKGVSIPFATIEKSSGTVVGSTRFGNIDRDNRRVEIGWTWINPEWQRTRINTEAKLLMLGHAFEVWKCVRVELKTDALNEKSRAAILRLGAKQEGILRRHMITDTGRFRDTVYFSIIDAEWEMVKEALLAKLKSRKVRGEPLI
jgi:RimJ/RimL family protein N-acetyltransferase